MNSYISRNWVPLTYVYVCANYYLQYKTVKYICLEDLMTPSKNDDNTLWLNFF